MTSPDPDPKLAARQNPSLSEDDLVEVEHERGGSSTSDDDDDGGEDVAAKPEPEDESGRETVPGPEENRNRPERKVTKPGEPAYVAPIPEIGPISPVSPIVPPVSQQQQPAPPSAAAPGGRPQLPEALGSLVVGSTVDEAGDIVDAATGGVLARAGGDLPSIVGRKVSNSRGDILGDDGEEVLGWVADLEEEGIARERSSDAGFSPQLTTAAAAAAPGGAPMAAGSMRSLAEMMARANKAGLMVDHLGNILDAQGNVVGRFHDNNNPAHRKEREERERAKAAALQAAADRAVRRAAAAQEAEKKKKTAEAAEASGEEAGRQEEGTAPTLPADGREEDEHDPECNCSKKKKQPGRRTEEERRENAAAWRKDKPGESPSDVFLDVKSTTEGIQLIIRIPTVFNGQQVRPTVQFS